MAPPRHTDQSSHGSGRREDGIALITVILVIFLLTATALSAVDFSGQEAKAGGQSRATMRSLYAADAGIQLALSRIQPPQDLSSFTFNLTDGTQVQSRSRTDAGPLALSSAGLGEPPDGYAINVGAGYVNEVFQFNVTAVGTNNLTSELESKVGVLSVNAGTY
jgi:type II secretory pathway component PulK